MSCFPIVSLLARCIKNLHLQGKNKKPYWCCSSWEGGCNSISCSFASVELQVAVSRKRHVRSYWKLGYVLSSSKRKMGLQGSAWWLCWQLALVVCNSSLLDTCESTHMLHENHPFHMGSWGHQETLIIIIPQSCEERPAVSSTWACFLLKLVRKRQPPSYMNLFVFFLWVQQRDAFSVATCVALALA